MGNERTRPAVRGVGVEVQQEIGAPADTVYGLVADAAALCLVLPDVVGADRLGPEGAGERLLVWTAEGGQASCAFRYREAQPDALRVAFRREDPAPPALRASGWWGVERLGPARCLLTLHHDFEVAAGRPEDAAWLEIVARTSGRDRLGRVKAAAELSPVLDGLFLSFEERAETRAAPETVHAFLHRADAWPAFLPHLTRAVVDEVVPGVQTVLLDTTAAGGAAHRTRSVRLCFPHACRILAKDVTPPPMVAAHAAEWSVEGGAHGLATAVVRHRVLLDPRAGAAVRTVRGSLGGTSAAVLEAAARSAATVRRPPPGT